MLTPSPRSVTASNPSGRLPKLAFQALLVPEAALILIMLGVHQALGSPHWTALVGLGLVALFGLRMGLLVSARWALDRAAYRVAYTLLNVALWLYPWSADGLGLLATIELACGRLNEAEQALRRAIVTCPGQPSLYAALSGVLIDQGQLPEARQAALQALAYDARHPAALLHLAGIERSQGASPAIVTALLTRGLVGARSADEALLRCALAELLLEDGFAAEALIQVLRAETLLSRCAVPQQAALHCHVGALIEQLGEPERAIHHFAAAERLDPHGRYASIAWRAARNL